MIINNKKNNNFRFVKPAGIFNVLHAVAALLFIALNFLESFKVINFDSNKVLYNSYMTAQLIIVILGIVAAVYTIRAIQPERQIMYYACFSITGLNCTFLLFTGMITIFAIVNLISGIIMLRDANSTEKKMSAIYNFGGSSSGLNQTKSTASIIEKKNEK